MTKQTETVETSSLDNFPSKYFRIFAEEKGLFSDFYLRQNFLEHTTIKQKC